MGEGGTLPQWCPATQMVLQDKGKSGGEWIEYLKGRFHQRFRLLTKHAPPLQQDVGRWRFFVDE